MTSNGIAEAYFMPNINLSSDERQIRDVDIQRHCSLPASERPSSSMWKYTIPAYGCQRLVIRATAA
jgi:hypothetical protein